MASEAADLRYPYPIEDPEVLTRQARTISNLGVLLLDTHAEVNDDKLKLRESWRSDTATKAVSDVQNLSSAMQGDSTSLADAAAAITTYVGHVDEARTDIDDIRRRYDEAERRSHPRQPASAGLGGPPVRARGVARQHAVRLRREGEGSRR